MRFSAALLAAAALLASLVAGPLAAPAQEQTFKNIDSGTPPQPLPTPSSWPYLWENNTWWPPVWPVCASGAHNSAGHHCRPGNGHVWPPPPPRVPVHPAPHNPPH